MTLQKPILSLVGLGYLYRRSTLKTFVNSQ